MSIMSTATLTNLRDYLYGTLSPSDMCWLGAQLMEYGRQQEDFPLKRYTMEEINAMLDEAEAEIAAGIGIADEEVWDELDEELAREKEERIEYAEAI